MNIPTTHVNYYTSLNCIHTRVTVTTVFVLVNLVILENENFVVTGHSVIQVGKKWEVA